MAKVGILPHTPLTTSERLRDCFLMAHLSMFGPSIAKILGSTATERMAAKATADMAP